jgi:hypothetical protein
MTTDVTQDLLAFRRFLDEQIESGQDQLTPEESLALWREQRRDLEESAAAIKQALAEMEAGDAGVPLEQFAAEFRSRNSIDSSL